MHNTSTKLASKSNRFLITGIVSIALLIIGALLIGWVPSFQGPGFGGFFNAGILFIAICLFNFMNILMLRHDATERHRRIAYVVLGLPFVMVAAALALLLLPSQ